MKKGDLVKYEDKLYMFVGFGTTADPLAVLTSFENDIYTLTYCNKDNLTLVAKVSHIYPPKFKRGQIVYYFDNVAVECIIINVEQYLNGYRYLVYANGYGWNQNFWVTEDELKEDYK